MSQVGIGKKSKKIIMLKVEAERHYALMESIVNMQSTVLSEVFELRKMGRYVDSRKIEEYKKRLNKIERLMK